MEIIIFVVAVVFFIRYENQINSLKNLLQQNKQKIDNLDKRYAKLIDAKFETAIKPGEKNKKAKEEKVVLPKINQEIKENSNTASKSSFGSWLGQDFLMKVGAVFVILAIVWLLSYLYINELIPLEALTIIGVVTGLSVAFVGERQIRARDVAGQVLSITGITIGVVTVVIAVNIFNIIGLTSAFVMLIALVGLLVWRAYVHNAKFMAATGLVGLYTLPALIVSPDPDYFFLANYGAVLGVLSFILSLFKKWSWLLTITILGSLIYSFTFGELGEYKLMYVFGFITMFFVGTIIRSVINKEKTESISVFNSILGNLVTIIWIFNLVPENVQTPILAILAALSLLTCYTYHLLKRDKSMISSQFFFMAIYIFALTSKELIDGDNNAYIPAIISLELFGMTLLSKLSLRSHQIIPRITVLSQGVALYMTFLTYNEDAYLYNLAIVAVLLGASSWLMQNEKDNSFFKVSLAGSILALHVLVWELMQELINNSNLASSISLILFTVAPIIILYYFRIKDEFWKALSWVAIGFVLIRLLFVEVWLLSQIMRVVAFMGIGLLFVLSAFISKQGKNKD